ncbi:DUF742 domain-containing protein [Kitasatospora atroaurantiaca]|uniref:Uncharacterized protein DUF742 n=1 Tax=Kitasatospora atroaurantiaca TaxID=285545 RepID=A0A561EUW2_9ACTN|nr:DUF742 domain-containing protein [Kitasatospora atroaurantiaca]TWE19402.1 uncharacterized protein DUF742 [Kitasatospora atroaurantiaca]
MGGEEYETGEVVRPFIVTAGRTRPVSEELRLETLVSAPPSALTAPLGFERHRIVELCQYPRSVAELAALLPTPLGVARVLVADLAAERYVRIHLAESPSVALLERIRDGLLRL